MIISLRSLASNRGKRRELRVRELEQERDAREQAVFDRIPRLAEIKAIQTEIGLDLARLMLRVPTRFRKSFDELQAWSLELSQERNQLLKQHGIDPAVLEVQWDCPACKNTGWLPPEEAGPDMVRAPEKCRCLIQEEIDDMYQAAGLAGPLREQTFERFDLTVYPQADRDYMRKVRDYCQQYAGEVAAGRQKESLFLMGGVGLGKTFLSSAIANVSVAAKRSVVYFTFAQFIEFARTARLDDDNDYRQSIQRLLDADLIVLDDLGSEKASEYVVQELFNLINHRMNRSLPMVISTNLHPSEIQDVFGARIASRLLNGFDSMMLKGEDVRWVLRRRRAQF